MPDRTQLFWLFFKFNGRVSRAAYFLAGLLLAVVQAFVLYRFTLVPEGSSAGQMWAMLFWMTFLVSAWSSVALGAKRLHDIGKPGLLAVALLVPAVSIAAFIFLCIFPGDRGPNRYGEATNSGG